MYCPNCNQELDGNFCPECGAKLVEKPEGNDSERINLNFRSTAVKGNINVSDTTTSTVNDITQMAAQKTN